MKGREHTLAPLTHFPNVCGNAYALVACPRVSTPRRRRMSLAAAVMVAAVSVSPAATAAITHPTAAMKAVTELTIPGAGVRLDATLYLPDTRVPAPAILLAHGFGGSKHDVVGQAESLRSAGYVVLAWTARGFGKSTGDISMDSPTAEGADVSRLVDYLAGRTEVQHDSAGDPHVGIAGASYGGAISLIAAAIDHRIDAVAADITWNNLQQALFPQSAVALKTPGVLKSSWVGSLFALTKPAMDSPMTGKSTKSSLVCGRLAPIWCSAYQASVVAGAPNPTLISLLRKSSPSSVANRIVAPTLLLQGEADSLFGLDESVRTARQIRLAHPSTPLAVVWHAGGHDNAFVESARQQTLVRQWFDKHLRAGTSAFPTFQVTESAGSISLADSAPAPKVFEAATLPLDAQRLDYPIAMNSMVIASPVGGQPAAVSSLPGIGAASLAGSAVTMLLPGQSAVWGSKPLESSTSIMGSPTVKVRVVSSSGDAVLFFSTLIKSASGGFTQPQGLVAPVHLMNIPRAGEVITAQLPSVVVTAAAGDSLVVAVSATDQSYDVPKDGRVYTITPVSALSVPTMTVTVAATASSVWLWPGIAAMVIAAAVLAGWLLRPRKPVTAPRESSEVPAQEVPLVAVRHLVKTYADDFTAVNNLSFEVRRGQVLGLLGPNGAGKTTTLRMLMGLILPTGGEIDIDGAAVYPGSPALARLGSFVEGPGFMPHLSGAANLDLYWRSTGRTEDPQLERALEIAGLGEALNKRVKAYSHGMKQRLAIAQAMLGMPDLLVLDEPTNGLDPSQIRAMRGVLRDYAATGRTIIVSSHLLAEVQQTCSHVVVMHNGHLVAAGAIEDILHKGSGTNPQLEDVFMALIGSDSINHEGVKP